MGDHPQDELAKFGYNPKMKVQNLIVLLYFCDSSKSLSKYGDFFQNFLSIQIFFPQDLATLVHFLHKNSCCTKVVVIHIIAHGCTHNFFLILKEPY
jgi:hypothetical protein